jgi:hypothetical protein
MHKEIICRLFRLNEYYYVWSYVSIFENKKTST